MHSASSKAGAFYFLRLCRAYHLKPFPRGLPFGHSLYDFADSWQGVYETGTM